MQTKSTKDYDTFKILTSNRRISKAHVRHLVRSMETNPDLFQFRPILVNKDMFVIDGQHRLTAAQQLGLPIWYVVGAGLTITDTQAMNENQQNWRPIDFARSHAALGKESYQQYIKFREDFPMFEHSVIMGLLSGTAAVGGSTPSNRKFKSGELDIPDIKQSRKIAEQMEEVYEITKPIISSTKSTSLMNAIMRMMRHPDYNHGQFIKHLKGVNEIKYRPNTKEYLRDMEDIYNFYKQNKTRFF